MNNKEKIKKQRKEHRIETKEETKNRHIKKKYGITMEEVIMSTNNIYEATGVLEISKARYLDIMKMSFMENDEEDNEDEEHLN